MKLTISDGKLRLRFVLGTGFVLFVVRKAVKSRAGVDGRVLKNLFKEIKKQLKEYKRKNGALTLLEIESGENERIVLKL